MTRGNWLALAASPTFALMALLTHVHGLDMICITGPDTSLLSGMVPMYLLMSLFHATPWFGLIRRRRNISGHTACAANAMVRPCSAASDD
jgi:hypothetical protein